MSLSQSLTSFRNAVKEVNSHIALAFQQDSGGSYVLSAAHRNFITDAAFLKMFIAWETFLESSFVKYMQGELSVLGNGITRFVQPVDDEHARKILIGTQRYVDWANHDIVRRLCNLYFDSSNPFDSFLGSIHSDLIDLKMIRNAAAHLTSTTGHQLDALGTRKLNRRCQNLSVSDFIFALDPTSTNGDTILTVYQQILDIAAEGIANG